MSEQEITPEFVSNLLRNSTDGEWYSEGNDVYADFGDRGFLIAGNISQQWDYQPDNALLVAASPRIAEAYLELTKENARLRSIIEQQREALEVVKDIFNRKAGLSEEDHGYHTVVQALAAAPQEYKRDGWRPIEGDR